MIDHDSPLCCTVKCYKLVIFTSVRSWFAHRAASFEEKRGIVEGNALWAAAAANLRYVSLSELFWSLNPSHSILLSLLYSCKELGQDLCPFEALAVEHADKRSDDDAAAALFGV